MNRLHALFRRVSVVAAGALLGLTGVALVASPASAHHPEPSGTYCLRGDNQVEVSWTVTNSERDLAATITKVKTNIPADLVGDLEANAPLPKKGQGQLTATQTHTFDGALPKPWLKVWAKWDRGGRIITEARKVHAREAGECEGKPTPSDPPTSAPPSDPPTSAPPSDPPTATPTPSTPVEPEEPVFRVEETCDEMIFTVKNPAKGVPFTTTLVTEKGVTETLATKPGETNSVSFDAYPGLEVTVSDDLADGSETIEYTEPQDCGGEGGGEPGLPLTGAAAGGIAAGAVVLLAVGGGLFVIARRRKLRFTA
ncbi:cell wall anchor protein [Salinispora arenicola]|uniref:cell wall anchor protein n=1 Tax=Salinispora arenicola TaxID=168697 RepID=UPI0014322F55|nr:cell wall anchor protein [Salinispora arenicola]NIL41438.1 cell wall anchor protein [Salinispora arenicola]